MSKLSIDVIENLIMSANSDAEYKILCDIFTRTTLTYTHTYNGNHNENT